MTNKLHRRHNAGASSISNFFAPSASSALRLVAIDAVGIDFALAAAATGPCTPEINHLLIARVCIID